ncbi:MAG: SIS domain-containing protein [Candidatus Gastranaerophilales bacterium]|nr:SIS domain-containing protein [Candidatus Gastranaerophilales bacterium]
MKHKKTRFITKTLQNRLFFIKISKKNADISDIHGMSTPNFIQNIKKPTAGFKILNKLSEFFLRCFKKSGRKYKFSMYEEIWQQPEIIKELANRYLPVNESVQNICLEMPIEDIKNLSKVYIVASGSSRNVGNIAKYFIETIAKLPVEVDFASEFAHRDTILSANDLVIAISQSGKTADTLAALESAKGKGAHTFALTNNPDSAIHNAAESKMTVGAGVEKSIAATKSFTAQLLNLYALALYLGEQRESVTRERVKELKLELHILIHKIEKLLRNDINIEKIAGKIKESKNLVILGRGTNYAAAQEGALKIKETSYIDANGYPTGEFLHGHMAVLNENTPVISIIVHNKAGDINYNLAIKNTEEIKHKLNPDLIIIKNQKDKHIETLFKGAGFINIPESDELISPMLTVITLQILAVKMADLLGRDVDHPRGLSKAVTAE